MIAVFVAIALALGALTGAAPVVPDPPPPVRPGPILDQPVYDYERILVAAEPAEEIETAEAADTLVVGCAVYAGPRLSEDAVLAAIALYDWTPYTDDQMLGLFRRESGLYLGAENVCTDDHGIPQINAPLHGDWCDIERVKTDLGYALWCAAQIYAAQGIRAWLAGEGYLWDDEPDGDASPLP